MVFKPMRTFYRALIEIWYPMLGTQPKNGAIFFILGIPKAYKTQFKREYKKWLDSIRLTQNFRTDI